MGEKSGDNDDLRNTGGYLLSRNGIIEAVKNDDIKIKYYCLPSDKTAKRNNESFCVKFPSSDSSNLQKSIWEHFLSCVEEDSLRLSVGPYALVENRTIFRFLVDQLLRKDFFHQQGQNIFNIFKNKNQLLRLYPRENCLIGTNEVISVSNKIGGSLYATVMNTDVGFPHISTTIDPCWSGKLQIGLVNPTNLAKELRLNEPICKVRFHRFPTGCDSDSVNKKPHANDWWELEKDKTSLYFPRRKESLTKDQVLKKDIKSFLTFLFSTGLGTVVVIIGILPMISQVQEVIKNANSMEEYKTKLAQLEWRIKDFEDAANENTLLRHDVYELTMIKDKEQFSVALPERLSRKPFVFLNFEGVRTADITYKVHYPIKGKDGGRYYDSVSIDIFVSDLNKYKNKKLTVHTVILADRYDRILRDTKSKN